MLKTFAWQSSWLNEILNWLTHKHRNCNLFSFSNNQTRFLGAHSKGYQDEFRPELLQFVRTFETYFYGAILQML